MEYQLKRKKKGVDKLLKLMHSEGGQNQSFFNWYEFIIYNLPAGNEEIKELVHNCLNENIGLRT